MEKTPEYKLRPLTMTDIPDILRLSKLFNFSWDKADYEAAITGDYRYNLGILANGQFAGFMLATTLYPIAAIELIAIDPSQQKKGLGALMVDNLLSYLKPKNFTEIELEVSDKNPANRFYQKIGFEVFNKRKAYYRDGSDALLMKYELPDAD